MSLHHNVCLQLRVYGYGSRWELRWFVAALRVDLSTERKKSSSRFARSDEFTSIHFTPSSSTKSDLVDRLSLSFSLSFQQFSFAALQENDENLLNLWGESGMIIRREKKSRRKFFLLFGFGRFVHNEFRHVSCTLFQHLSQSCLAALVGDWNGPS